MQQRPGGGTRQTSSGTHQPHALVTSYTTTATLESRMYEGIRDRKRSCPAVSLRHPGAGGAAAITTAGWPQQEVHPQVRQHMPAAAGSRAAAQPRQPPPAWPSGPPPSRQPAGTHHSCSRTVRSSRYIVLDRKSMPMVAWWRRQAGRGAAGSTSGTSSGLRRQRRLAAAAAAAAAARASARPAPRAQRTWYVVSNLSYMKRVMMLVLPTDWSPRKTSLRPRTC